MWKKTLKIVKNTLLNLAFPDSCFFCKTKGTLLCPDCASLCDISPAHQKRRVKFIADCYAACSYRNRLVKRLIAQFKYEPFCSQLAAPLSVLIANHFSLLDQKPDFSSYTIVPVPLSKQRQRWRGFNQAKELADQLAVILDLECDSKCLIRTKNTATQVGLPSNKRALNIAGAFACPTRKDVAGKKILLIDDIITTGATMEECAKTLLKNGAAEIVALAVAHAEVSDV